MTCPMCGSPRVRTTPRPDGFDDLECPDCGFEGDTLFVRTHPPRPQPPPEKQPSAFETE